MIDQALLSGFEREARDVAVRVRKRVDREVRDSVRSSRISVRCRRGCANCCDMEVRIGLAEATVMAGELSAEARAALLSHDARVRSFAETTTEFSKLYRQTVGDCALLASDGSCSAYGGRPLACRGVVSVAPAVWCAKISGDGASPAESDAMLAAVASGAVDVGTPFLAAAGDAASAAVPMFEEPAFRRLGFTVHGVMSSMLALVANPSFWRAVVLRDPRATRDALQRLGIWKPQVMDMIASSGQTIL